MLVTETIRAYADVPAEIADDETVLQATGARMAEALQSVADTYAVDIDERDVVVWRAGQKPEQNIVVYGAQWSPDPQRRGVMLVGGSHDGETLQVPADPARSYGAPLPWPVVQVMALPQTDLGGYRRELPDEPQTATQPETYERTGIDPDRRQWVYTIQKGK